MGGNSWLAMVQWQIASQNPPSLAAIAPWEGNTDFYRDTLARGGVPYPYDAMWKVLQDSMVGRTGAEAPISMLEQYPLYNEYWDDKNVKLEKINVPAYVLASFSSALHTTGSVRGYHDISSKDKWYVASYPSYSTKTTHTDITGFVSTPNKNGLTCTTRIMSMI